MPTIKTIEIPRPENWQDFEHIVESYARIKWPGYIVTYCGSNGQIQHGVDIYAKNRSGEFIGIQCKKVTRLSFKSIEQEVEKAKKFKPPLKHYLIASTVKRNAELQEKVNTLDLRHNADGLFSVDILFWEDIVELLKTDRDTMEQLYPEIFCDDLHGDRIIIRADNNSGSIKNNVINIFNGKGLAKEKKAVKGDAKPYITGVVGNDPLQNGYVEHLIERWKKFKEADFKDKSEMKYFFIYNAIKRYMGFKWNEVPCELFEYYCTFLQDKIDNTKLGRKRKKYSEKSYSTYDEYVTEKYTNRIK